MPYIKQEERTRFGEMFRKLYEAGKINNPGELNYLFTIIINHYLIGNGINYQRINDVMGALEGAKLEMSRRVAAPYEDSKILQNGDLTE
jgi:hypothetical protein